MSAGTVVITGGIIAAVILLTIVTVLCCCRLQYYCCKSDGSAEDEEEEEKEKEPEFTKSLPGPAHQSKPTNTSSSLQPLSPLIPPSLLTSPSRLSLPCPPERSSFNQFPKTTEHHKPNGPAICRRYSAALSPDPIHSHMFCPSCSGLLPFYLPREQEVRNGGGRISYRSLEQQEVDLPMDIPSYNKLNLIRSITMREMVSHQSISTDV
ncbi:protein FAM163B-like [Silurus meridionalis]|nr:protein FAM163B-like [Silurus meridionalis]